MKCNWCGEGTGKNYATDKKTRLNYYYYCSVCIGDFTIDPLKKNEEATPYANGQIKEFLADLKEGGMDGWEIYHKWEKRLKK